MNDTNNKRPWFGPKKHGWGYNPITWQGAVYVVVAIAAEIGLVLLFQHFNPTWFGPKQYGWGWRALNWQGYAVIFAPIVVFVIGGVAIHRK